MKRLTSETVKSIELEEESELSVEDVISPSADDMTELPTRVFDYNLTKLKSFKQKQKNHKFASQGKLFMHDLGVVLSQYSVHEHQFDLELLTTVLNIAESFFIHGSDHERAVQKEHAVEELMKKYFRNDVEILNLMIKSVSGRIKRSTYMARKWKKFRSFFW